MEFAVAIVLILLGLNAAASLVRGAATRVRGGSNSREDSLVVHSHAHTHDGAMHSHPHVHADLHGHDHEAVDDATHHDHRIDADRLPSFAARRPLLRSFAVGLVHGLAGSAAIALLVLSAIPESAVGDALPRDFLRRHDYRHGIDHDRDRHADHGRVAADVVASPAAGHRLRTAEFRLRPVPRLPDRYRRSSLQARLRSGFRNERSIAVVEQSQTPPRVRLKIAS